MTEIRILGCGWLGIPLAKSLLQKGYSVKGSTTSPDKLPLLATHGIEPFLISVGESELSGNSEGFLADGEILIVDFPPQIATGSFVEKIRTLVGTVQNSSIKKVLFASSVSVYGESNEIVTEESATVPKTEAGKQILEAEALLRQANFQTTVLRLGGLIGEDRHPVKHLAGRSGLPNPDAPVNLIHLKDCIGIIEWILVENIWNQTFNAVAPFNRSRKDFYSKTAAELGLPCPLFDTATPSVGKRVSSQKLIDFGYRFSDSLQ